VNKRCEVKKKERQRKVETMGEEEPWLGRLIETAVVCVGLRL
jgi:hypothetical protein